jgi:hypothetical protein
MSFEVSFERGAGRSLEPRIPGTVPLKKAIEATSKPAPSKQRAQPSYWDLVREIEASVCNPPPCEIGMTVDCTAWLEQNAKQSDVVTLPCGLSYKVLAHGREKAKKSPKLNTPVLCHYRGFLHDGTEFDSSYGRGQPYEFVPANMIQGWTVAMQLMAEGDTWELYVPAQLAYGRCRILSYSRTLIHTPVL